MAPGKEKQVPKRSVMPGQAGQAARLHPLEGGLPPPAVTYLVPSRRFWVLLSPPGGHAAGGRHARKWQQKKQGASVKTGGGGGWETGKWGKGKETTVLGAADKSLGVRSANRTPDRAAAGAWSCGVGWGVGKEEGGVSLEKSWRLSISPTGKERGWSFRQRK